MCNKNNAPIGVFDSGVGGLTVVREIMRHLPNENLVYLSLIHIYTLGIMYTRYKGASHG